MEYPYIAAKYHIEQTVKKILETLQYPIQVSLEIPPKNMGDFSFPCHSLCKYSKCSPQETADKIKENINKDKIIKDVTTTNGYINFEINTSFLIDQTINLIFDLEQKYGHHTKRNKKVIIEHTSANPNGPLHVGRARNPIIGDTITRIFTAVGYDCETQFYLDDLGKQVAILSWGMQHINNIDLTSVERNKSDHKSVLFYQKANELMKENEEIQNEIGIIVKKSEQGDNETLALVKKAYNPVLDGILESLHTINISIDSFVPESKFVENKMVEKVISDLKQTKYCYDEDGAYYLDLDFFGIHGRNKKFFITRSDGTSLYATRDIAYHLWKAKKADLLINILGEDHKLESKQVKIGLQLLNEENVPHPVFYSFVSLPGGKMSTRRGRVVYLDDLIDECIQRAYEEVKKRRGHELTDQEMKEIARVIGVGSLRYNIIKVQPEKDIMFKWEEALNFEGNAAPFIQYAHARAAGILNKIKADKKNEYASSISTLNHPSEIELGKKMAMFPEIIQNAANGFKPHLITSYLFEIASVFNQFYRDCPVFSEKGIEIRNQRILLVKAVKIVLNNGLNLLGIEAPDEM